MIRLHPEKQYLSLIQNIIKNGEREIGRNGYTKSIIGADMRFSLNDNKIPFITTKKLAWKSCLKELLWFINGETDNEILQNQGVKIWNENSSEEFLQSRNLFNYEENDLGPIYGYQWRHFNKRYTNKKKHNRDKQISKFFGKGKNNIDQLQNIIDSINDPKKKSSRRLIMTAWNPCQLDQMALPPCHIISQFHILGGRLSCSMYQRSGDIGLGIPFNIASYSFLTILLAHHCGIEPGEFIHFIGNAHIYEEHEEALLKQVKREPFQFPKCFINKKYNDIDHYKFEDFVIKDYKFHDKIKMEMKA
jgi:thymidylate synthase